MKAFALLPAEERKIYFNETAARIGIKADYVEKDFWVCWTLQQLFGLPEIGNHLTFKGGTSLSKAYRLIQRFSEDIDITISREYLGFGGDHDPGKAPSNKKRKEWLEGLRQACRDFVKEKLQSLLGNEISQSLEGMDDTVSMDGQDPDQQTLLFRYPGCWPESAAGYVGKVVRIEMGARSDTWPNEQVRVHSYVAEHFPQAFAISGCEIQVLAKERTFWEKLSLLHEENCRPTDKPVKSRMSRHYSDLARMIEAGVGDSALSDMSLFERVVEHRSVFFSHNWVKYDEMKPGF
jgi:Nucleotidyl transferase AbiEii toxin, Type IV TA system